MCYLSQGKSPLLFCLFSHQLLFARVVQSVLTRRGNLVGAPLVELVAARLAAEPLEQEAATTVAEGEREEGLANLARERRITSQHEHYCWTLSSGNANIFIF